MFCVSGRITEGDVGMLRALLEQERGIVAIDLKDVRIVDREAIELLAAREADGVELRNSPPYIREWVTKETGNTFAERTKGREGRGEDA